MIRLIASDIDGTLLQNEATEIPREIFAHIHRLEQKGILFCPASGRQYASLRKLFAPVADKVPFLCENGAVVYGPGNPGPSAAPELRARFPVQCRTVAEILETL